MNWLSCGKKQWWSNTRYCSGNCLEGTDTTKKNLRIADIRANIRIRGLPSMKYDCHPLDRNIWSMSSTKLFIYLLIAWFIIFIYLFIYMLGCGSFFTWIHFRPGFSGTGSEIKFTSRTNFVPDFVRVFLFFRFYYVFLIIFFRIERLWNPARGLSDNEMQQYCARSSKQ